jgi:hypothetical protein
MQKKWEFVAVNRATAWLRTQQAVSGQFGFGAGSTIDALFVIAALDPRSPRSIALKFRKTPQNSIKNSNFFELC